ncbi:MAG: DUF4263 domain-containing protein [Patescibacteria group bacterium]|nr:DUF4263 domain-containing protein [Patescibacteria group bacterium]
MTVNPTDFREVIYPDGQKLFFSKKHSFHDHFAHKRKTTKFPYHKNILLFLKENPAINIYFTLDEEAKPFKKIEQGFLINMVSYSEFCKTIGTKTGGRSKAFLGQNLSLKDINFTDNDKDEFIRANASEKNIVGAVQSLHPDVQKKIMDSLSSLETINTYTPKREINQNEFVSAFTRFLTDSSVQAAFYNQLPHIQIEILKSHIKFLKENLDKNETFIQNWIDEDDGKFRKQRCLIFGLEYVDPKREGQVSGKKFDILAEQDLEHHVIFELKSPKDEIFKITEESTVAGGVTTEYNISPQLSRAIPEVLGYKGLYEKASNEELQKIGVNVRKPIRKCVIVLGTKKDDPVWKDNFERVSNCLNGIELLTYNHLIERLENTVKNLEENTSAIT